MKTPPPVDEHVARPAEVVVFRDRRFLIFIRLVLVAFGLGFKSELLARGQVWGMSAGLVVLALPALLAYLRSDAGLPAIEHFVPVTIGAITLAGLSVLVADAWQYSLIVLAFGIGFYLAGRLDYLRLQKAEKPGHVVVQEAILAFGLAGAYLVVIILFAEPTLSQLLLRLLWIFTLTFLASYRSFRVAGTAITPRRAFLFSLFVGQVVTFLAWAITALYPYLVVGEGYFAVMLMLAWYINRGLVRHTVEDSFNRHVVLEYAAFAAVLGYLFISSYQPPR